MFVFLCCIVAALALGNGVNLQPSYYNNGQVTFGWSFMQSFPQIKSVRIEIEPDKVSQAVGWISQALQNGYAVVATYHRYGGLGSDSTSEIYGAADWWVTNYATLHASGDFTINLINEWGSHSQTASSYSSAYNEAIRRVRQVYSGPIICDLAGWGQEFNVAASASSMITDQNIIFSAHIYSGAYNQGGGGTVVVNDVNNLHNTGRPCMIGEFGPDSSSGCDVVGVVNQARSLGWPVFAWAWNGDGGSMNMVTPNWGSNAQASSYSADSYWMPKVINLLSDSVPSSTPTSCTDTPPTSDYTCAQQAGWGKCSESWMAGFCQQSCGTCPSSPVPVTAPVPVPVPVPVTAPVTSSCVDNPPPSYTCQQQAVWGKCSESWMQSPVCDVSCNRCAGSGKGDWVFCSSNAQCTNNCCSKEASDDEQFKCTPGGTQCGAGLRLADPDEQTQQQNPSSSSKNVTIIVVCSVLSVAFIIAIAGVVYALVTKSTMYQ